jgi:transcriptional repressor NrdR
LKCPKCGSSRSSVVDSRGDPSAIRRRRECQECEFRFTTFERIEYALPLVIKKDGRREPFNLLKLRAGLIRACEKRPISVEQVDVVANRIERRVSEMCLKELESVSIGDLVMEELKELDHIAYIRFASVYQEFSDIEQFVETLHSLRSEGKKRKKARGEERLENPFQKDASSSLPEGEQPLPSQKQEVG